MVVVIRNLQDVRGSIAQDEAAETETETVSAPAPTPTQSPGNKHQRAVIVASSSIAEETRSDEGEDSKQTKITNSQLINMVVAEIQTKVDVTLKEEKDAKNKQLVFANHWAAMKTKEQRTLLVSNILTTTLDIAKAQLCKGNGVALNGLVTIKPSCQLARQWSKPPLGNKPASVSDRLRCKFSLCEDLKKKLNEASVPIPLKEQAVLRRNVATKRAEARAAKATQEEV